MPIAASLFVMTTLAVQSPQMPASAPAPAPVSTQQGESGTSSSSDRPHQFGVGGTMGVSSRGGGGSFRYFFGDRLGLDMNVGMSRLNIGGTTRTNFQAAPSAMWMFTHTNQLADVDVRPYVGAGLNYSTSSGAIRTSNGIQGRVSGLGQQVFGGVELTFSGANWVAISAQVAYYRLSVSTFNTNIGSGTNFYLLFHFYLN
jgi:outer membrane protein W